MNSCVKTSSHERECCRSEYHHWGIVMQNTVSFALNSQALFPKNTISHDR